ncbi:MAG: hypothetical protein HFG31_06785 [Eubacterium sp.]|nr:hypothetical protein [Eubacterium sp.]
MKKISLKKKIVWGFIIVIFLAVFMYWWFVLRVELCLNYNRDVMENNLYFTCNDLGDCAYASTYQWDGKVEHKNITIPDEAGGNKVTRLGGFSGKGCPEPFVIELSDDAYGVWVEEEIHILKSEKLLEGYGVGYEVQDVKFTLNIGKKLNKIVKVDMSNYFPKETENGKIILYHPVVYIECDKDNRTFYSKDGKLYYKSNDEVIDDFDYAK